jgi:hypothetical protein
MSMGNGGQPGNLGGQTRILRRNRGNIDNYGDPYLTDIGPDEMAACSVCEAIYSGQRWYLKDQVDPAKVRAHPVHYTICPACRKTRDRSPGGIVNLHGGFIKKHKDDILNLIHNEGERAKTVNPLERIIDLEGNDGDYTVLTTNERLAQRIGRALHKAYDGDVSYKWSEDNKLVRVSWRRE